MRRVKIPGKFNKHYEKIKNIKCIFYEKIIKTFVNMNK